MAQKFILPGSTDLEDGKLSCAVFIGENEWDIHGNKTLRYIEGNINDAEEGETVEAFFFRIYDNSTGCLIQDTFKMNGSTK